MEHIRAGGELRARGRLADAQVRFEQAVAADPAYVSAHTALAAVLISRGFHKEAVSSVEAALAIDPDDVTAQHCLGLLFLERALFEPAIAAFERCVRLDPGHSDAWRNLAAAQRAYGQPDGARRTVERALRHIPDDRGLHASLAALCEFFGEHDRVLELLGPRISTGSFTVEELLTYTTSLQALGRVQEARELLSSTVPDLTAGGEVYRLEFALARLLDRTGEYDAAFAHLRRGNAGKHARFEPGSHRRYVDAIIDGVLKLRRSGPPAAGSDSQRPVFIVGMPRSGTSLLEQIIAAHPSAAGAGELGTIPLLAQLAAGNHPKPGGTQVLTDAESSRLASAYLGELNRIDRGASRVTDKMWENFEYLGFIERLFPRARVLHCLRDPYDTAISCYFQHFAGANGVAFSYDLAHLGEYYRQYERLMTFWRQESKLPILDVRYEDVVRETEIQARRVLAFLGLDWSDECLNFHASARTVNTASYDQVRRPVYTSSIGRGRHYRHHLQPFAQAAGLGARDRRDSG